MTYIEEILKYLGKPYSISTIDGESVIYRKFEGFEFEVSGVNKNTKSFTLYVWRTQKAREVIAIYENIKGEENLKDFLGHCSTKYRNLLSEIRVERED